MIKSLKNIFKIELDPNRIFGLDILRAFAILFVVIGHGKHLISPKFIEFNQLFVFDGVCIFFVLSGFLIGGILIRSIDGNTFDKKLLFNFWKRRWYRTLPTYFLILTLLTVLNYLFIDNFSLLTAFKFYTFSQNLFYDSPIGFFTEAWSLSVEEWFYLTTPLLIIFFIRIFKINAKKSVLVSALVLIFLVTLFRYYRYLVLPIDTIYQWGYSFRGQVITRLDSLMFGVLGAYLKYYNSNWLKYKKTFLLIGLILLVISKYIIKEMTDFNGLYDSVFSFTTFSIATLLLLPYLSDYKKENGFVYKWITIISLISYSMYLLHSTVIQSWIIKKIIPWFIISNDRMVIKLLQYGLYWILSISLSILLYKYFEIPMTKLRDKKTTILSKFTKK